MFKVLRLDAPSKPAKLRTVDASTERDVKAASCEVGICDFGPMFSALRIEVAKLESVIVTYFGGDGVLVAVNEMSTQKDPELASV
jgi:hypothetical protein